MTSAADDKKEMKMNELIQYLWDIGFLIQSKSYFEIDNDVGKKERLKTLHNDGFRIQLWGETIQDACVINIKGNIVPQEIEDELINVYRELKGGK